MNRVSRWDGEIFTALGEGFNGRIQSAVRFDDGSGVGPAIYVAGLFNHAGTSTARGVARFVNGAWEQVGPGFDPVAGSPGVEVRVVKVFDDGDGPKLYAGGSFHSSGGVVVNNIARWDGSSWTPLGGGVTLASAGVGVYDLEVFDEGSGPALYVCGTFTSAGGVAGTGGIARWNGTNWSSVGGGATQAQWVLHVHDDGVQKVLVVGGIGGLQGLTNIARWNGVTWSGFGAGLSNGGVHALATWNDGTGIKLYAGGQFQNSGAQSVARLAQWNGSTWQTLGGGLDNTVFDMIPFDDGTGEMLYIGGRFNTEANPVPSNRIVAWNGTEFISVNGGMGGDGPDFTVNDLAVLHDGLGGGGPSLYALGGFMQAGPHPSPYIAKWQGCLEDVPGSVGDLDNNGVVNVADLLLLLAAWGPCAGCAADLNGDNVVNILDLLMLLENWD